MRVEKRYCDICGKEINLSAPLKVVRHFKKKSYVEILDNDCCEQCLIKIMRFIDNLKNVHKTELIEEKLQ